MQYSLYTQRVSPPNVTPPKPLGFLRVLWFLIGILLGWENRTAFEVALKSTRYILVSFKWMNPIKSYPTFSREINEKINTKLLQFFCFSHLFLLACFR